MERTKSDYFSKSDKDFKENSHQLASEISSHDNKKFLSNQIMNYLYFEYANIDLFSINELESLICYSGYNKQKTLYYLEKYSKEELIKIIEDSNLNTIKKSKSSEIHPETFKMMNDFKIKKENFYISSKAFINIENVKIESAWNFINSSVNIVDLKDVLNSYDHYKLIKKAKSVVKDKDNYKLNEYFERYAEMRERKFKELFKRNLEDNDLQFLEGDIFMEAEVMKKKKRNVNNNLTENLLRSDLNQFPQIFVNSRNLVKINILEYLDIFSIGRFGLCNKSLYKYIYNPKEFNLEHFAKKYCVAIFKNSSLYLNDQDKIKESYKNYMHMLKKRPRVRLSGIYYSKVKFNKLGDNYGNNNEVISTVIYFRIYRFLPNGEIFSITTPHFKQAKLQNAINKNNVEMKRGRYFVDYDDSLLIEIASGNTTYVYKYKMKEIVEFPDLKFNGLELVEYGYTEDNQFNSIKINQYFPRIFKFRSLDILKNDIFISRRYE